MKSVPDPLATLCTVNVAALGLDVPKQSGPVPRGELIGSHSLNYPPIAFEETRPRGGFKAN